MCSVASRLCSCDKTWAVSERSWWWRRKGRMDLETETGESTKPRLKPPELTVSSLYELPNAAEKSFPPDKAMS